MEVCRNKFIFFLIFSTVLSIARSQRMTPAPNGGIPAPTVQTPATSNNSTHRQTPPPSSTNTPQQLDANGRSTPAQSASSVRHTPTRLPIPTTPASATASATTTTTTTTTTTITTITTTTSAPTTTTSLITSTSITLAPTPTNISSASLPPTPVLNVDSLSPTPGVSALPPTPANSLPTTPAQTLPQTPSLSSGFLPQTPSLSPTKDTPPPSLLTTSTSTSPTSTSMLTPPPTPTPPPTSTTTSLPTTPRIVPTPISTGITTATTTTTTTIPSPTITPTPGTMTTSTPNIITTTTTVIPITPTSTTVIPITPTSTTVIPITPTSITVIPITPTSITVITVTPTPTSTTTTPINPALTSTTVGPITLGPSSTSYPTTTTTTTTTPTGPTLTVTASPSISTTTTTPFLPISTASSTPTISSTSGLSPPEDLTINTNPVNVLLMLCNYYAMVSPPTSTDSYLYYIKQQLLNSFGPNFDPNRITQIALNSNPDNGRLVLAFVLVPGQGISNSQVLRTIYNKNWRIIDMSGNVFETSCNDYRVIPWGDNWPCPDRRCANDGVCRVGPNGQYGCKCKPMYAGRYCDNNLWLLLLIPALILLLGLLLLILCLYCCRRRRRLQTSKTYLSTTTTETAATTETKGTEATTEIKTIEKERPKPMQTFYLPYNRPLSVGFSNAKFNTVNALTALPANGPRFNGGVYGVMPGAANLGMDDPDLYYQSMGQKMALAFNDYTFAPNVMASSAGNAVFQGQSMNSYSTNVTNLNPTFTSQNYDDEDDIANDGTGYYHALGQKLAITFDKQD